MAELIKSLIKKRGTVKSKLTRFVSFLEKFTNEGDLVELKIRLETVRPVLKEFEDFQNELESADEENDYSADYEEFENLYFSTMSKAEKQLGGRTSQSATDSLSTSSSNQNTSTENHAVSVRLPTVNIPTFTGRFDEWMPFIDTFKSLIDTNEHLSEVQKLQYLKGSLKGQAAEVLQNLDITSLNYKIALDLLHKQFHNSRLITQRHIKALFELPSVQRDSPASLRQLVTTTLTHMRAIQALKVDTKNWDPLIIHMLTARLDQATHKEWELSVKPDEQPTLNELTDHLLKRSQTLESVAKAQTMKPSPSTHNASRNVQNAYGQQAKTKTYASFKSNSSCQICSGKHKTYWCKFLRKGTYLDKVRRLKTANLCANCLSHGHNSDVCRSEGCKRCSAKHNTLIHPPDSESQAFNSEEAKKDSQSGHNNPTKSLLSSVPAVAPQVLLNTAVVQVIGPTGRVIKCRALLDNGSESSYITEHMVQALGLKKVKQNILVTGVNQQRQQVNHATHATIQSCVTSYKSQLAMLVIPKITGNLPSHNIKMQGFNIPSHITLADPAFNVSNKIDILIGQELFWDLICIGQIKTPGMPTLQKTKLGWLVGGTLEGPSKSQNTRSCYLTTLDDQLQKFWLLEEPVHYRHLTLEEAKCEEHYVANTKREKDGTYIVKMPLQEDTDQLGESRKTAERRFLQVERRLNNNPQLKRQYEEFMDEYLALGHMELVKEEANQNRLQYFLPHHPVIKESSSTTKVRVVFDASAKTTSGKSLNDLQLVGPTVQPDLFSIISRFRMHNYVLAADLEKMYRMVSINETQRDLLSIFWRKDQNRPLQIYRLKTVTYGTASAPFLATRTLQQLATDEGQNFPEVAPIVKQDFYVDDLLTGAATYEQARKLQEELIALLSKGGFHLRKWNSNSEELLRNVPEEIRERQPKPFPSEEDSTVKTLGLWWNAGEDTFQFKYTPVERKNANHVSKRMVLSDIARLFDPLGLVAPIIVRPKLLLQELWKEKLDWDESLPMNLHTQWMAIQKCLSEICQIRIPRQVTQKSTQGDLEIHGFSDASELAYGCVIYLRHNTTDGLSKVSLMCSKSRVAPLRSTSLPRLELCAAVLLTEVTNHIQSALNVSCESTFYWSDSTVVLAWIKAEPARWTTFVANRVAKIQEITKNSEWRHVRTHENPADLVSRGETAKQLTTSELWWHGPTWLTQPSHSWPGIILDDTAVLPEERRQHTTVCVSSHDTHSVSDLITRRSSFTKVVRIVAYCRRFICKVSRSKFAAECSTTGPLTVLDLASSTTIIVKHVQETSFKSELKSLSEGKPLLSDSKLLTLSPFISEDGLIRVGGRLDESQLTFEQKHQILLPKGHRVTELIAQEEHTRNLHCGPQALLCAIRRQYWPINGRDLVRKITRQCVTCFRVKPKHNLQQKMGVLPQARVTPARPFLHTGIDYCGPFHAKLSKRRGTRPIKVYVAVFVCLATRAVHLELVTDLTTEAFLGALRRFTSRRGICQEIFSDNGRNFVGAKRELEELFNFLKAESTAITNGATANGIKWNFNPPYAPHMGGLWEAAVKSFKYHFYRIAGRSNLTIEELTTLSTQIEAVLNSRPLTPCSNDPSDLSVLTPSHFLIGSPLKALPEPSLTHLPEQRLSRWQRVQQLVQHFWSRWSSEYLASLQQRSKWKSASPSLQVGSMVLLKDDNLPPLAWPLGRVSSLHPGKDNLVRVVTVKTSHGTHRRSVAKLCLLPIEA